MRETTKPLLPVGVSSDVSDEELVEMLTLNVIILPSGTKIWRDRDGLIHREYGPAYEAYSGYIAYYIHGKRHRTDGPATIWPEGDTEYWINGKQVDPF